MSLTCGHFAWPHVTAIAKGAAQPVDVMPPYARSIDLCRSPLKTRLAVVKDVHGTSRLIMAEKLCLRLLATRLTMPSLQRAGFQRSVLSNMAPIISVSKDANVISAKFVVEPFLAIAAIMEMGEKECLDLLIHTLANMMVSGGVSNILATGKAGEFIAFAIFMLAHDRALARILSIGGLHPRRRCVVLPRTARRLYFHPRGHGQDWRRHCNGWPDSHRHNSNLNPGKELEEHSSKPECR